MRTKYVHPWLLQCSDYLDAFIKIDLQFFFDSQKLTSNENNNINVRDEPKSANNNDLCLIKFRL